MKKPGAVIHMAYYGLVLGFLLGMAYLWISLGIGIFLYGDMSLSEVLFSIPWSVGTAFAFGSIPGLLMGIIEGGFLAILTRPIQHPMTERSYKKWMIVTSGIMGGAPLFVIGAIVLSFTFNVSGSVVNPVVFLLPVLIASFASGFAANRYMLKLRAWSTNIEKAKNKAKSTPENNLAYQDNLSGDALDLPATENQSRINQG